MRTDLNRRYGIWLHIAGLLFCRNFPSPISCAAGRVRGSSGPDNARTPDVPFQKTDFMLQTDGKAPGLPAGARAEDRLVFQQSAAFPFADVSDEAEPIRNHVMLPRCTVQSANYSIGVVERAALGAPRSPLNMFGAS